MLKYGRESINLSSLRASVDFDRLSQAARRIVDLLLLNRSIFISELRTHTLEIKDVIAKEQAETRTLIEELVQQKGISQATSASYVQSTTASDTERICQDRREHDIWKWLLNSLAFPAMRNREEEISLAYHATFEWVFNEPPMDTEALPWTSFVQWLWQGDDVYWIHGKAGSGKSTLIKYIFNDKRTPKALSRWAGSAPFMVANFPPRNNGTREQRSQLGLLRSLLFQILQYQPTITRLIFPEEWARLQSKPDFFAQEWTLNRLQGAVYRFIKLSELPMKICFFIDGLDEFEGNDERNDPSYLVQMLQILSESPFVKVCISSRPLPLFEKAFRTSPSLRLQDLTAGDIQRYVQSKLTEDDRMQQLALEEPRRREYFIKEISEKAHGVFLWVKLVVRSLLNGLGNQDRIEDLEARLSLLPAGLEQLYRHMLMRVEPIYLRKASEVFQLVRTAQHVQDLRRRDGQRTTPVTVLQLELAISDSTIDMADSEGWTIKRLSLHCDKMRTRLQTWCAGLLEVPDFFWNRLDPIDPTAALRTKVTWEVAYLHRTARDFLETESIWRILLKYTANTDFEPHARQPRSTVQLYQIVGPIVPTPLGHGLFRKELLDPLLQALVFAQRAKTIDGDAYFKTLDKLDEVVGNHLSRWSGHYFGHWSQFVGREQSFARYQTFLDLAVAYNLEGYVITKIGQEHRQFLLKAREGLVEEDPYWAQNYFKRYKRSINSIDNAQQPTLWGMAGEGVQYYAKKREVFGQIREVHPVTLLDIALEGSCPNPSMTETLLAHGADPNEVSGSERLWEHVLSRVEASSKCGIEGKQWLQIISLLLTHGADPRGFNTRKRRIKQDRDAAKLLLWAILDDFDVGLSTDVESSRIVIDKMLPWSKRRRMKRWKYKRLGKEK